MGAKLKTTNLEYAPSLNWLLALAAAGLAVGVFLVRRVVARTRATRRNPALD